MPLLYLNKEHTTLSITINDFFFNYIYSVELTWKQTKRQVNWTELWTIYNPK